MFEDQDSKMPKYKISLKDATPSSPSPKSESTEISLKLKENNIDKEYIFKCNNEQEKYNLIKALTKAINNSKNEINGIQMETIKIKERKLEIIDNLIEKNKIGINDIEDHIFEFVKDGKYFQIDEKKMERQMEINKEKRKKELKIEQEKKENKEKEIIEKQKLRNSTKKKEKKFSFRKHIKKFFNYLKGKKDKNDN